jgi:hypothetical protein
MNGHVYIKVTHEVYNNNNNSYYYCCFYCYFAEVAENNIKRDGDVYIKVTHEVYCYYYYYYYYYHHLISHFSALAAKYSPILGFSNQQD